MKPSYTCLSPSPPAAILVCKAKYCFTGGETEAAGEQNQNVSAALGIDKALG